MRPLHAPQEASASLPWRDDLDSVAIAKRGRFASAFRDKLAVQRRGDGRVLEFKRGEGGRERDGLDVLFFSIDDELHRLTPRSGGAERRARTPSRPPARPAPATARSRADTRR